MFGFLNVYKPRGKTSHDIVAILRRITKIKQIGHTGTLDPFAEGVLPICIGKATRLIEYLDDDKAYIGTIQLGSQTTTYDTEGEIVKHSDKIIDEQNIQECLQLFKGEIEQTPPIFSAIKLNGKKLYEYAREGKEVEIKPRKIQINEIKLLNFDKQKQIAEIYIECSKGTYIRSIANDLGIYLGTYGHLIKLVRTKAGNFNIKQAIMLEDLQNIESVKNKLIAPPCYLDYPKYQLSEEEKEKISHGVSIQTTDNCGIVLLMHNNNLIAVGNAENQQIKCLKVFI